MHALHTCGLLHSDTLGSYRACQSPRLFAAYRVLLRLLMPRHPPCALISLNTNLAELCLDLSEFFFRIREKFEIVLPLFSLKFYLLKIWIFNFLFVFRYSIFKELSHSPMTICLSSAPAALRHLKPSNDISKVYNAQCTVQSNMFRFADLLDCLLSLH